LQIVPAIAMPAVLPLDAPTSPESALKIWLGGQLLLAADPGHVRSAHHPLDAIAFDYYSSIVPSPSARTGLTCVEAINSPELSPPHQRG